MIERFIYEIGRISSQPFTFRNARRMAYLYGRLVSELPALVAGEAIPSFTLCDGTTVDCVQLSFITLSFTRLKDPLLICMSITIMLKCRIPSVVFDGVSLSVVDLYAIAHSLYPENGYIKHRLAFEFATAHHAGLTYMSRSAEHGREERMVELAKICGGGVTGTDLQMRLMREGANPLMEGALLSPALLLVNGTRVDPLSYYSQNEEAEREFINHYLRHRIRAAITTTDANSEEHLIQAYATANNLPYCPPPLPPAQ